MLKKLRRQPRAVKQFYAFWGAAGMTGIVASVWLVSLAIKFSDTNPLPTTGEENTAGAFSQFFDKIQGGAIDSLKNKFQNQDDSTQNEATTKVLEATTTETSTKVIEKNSKTPIQIGTTTSQRVLVGTSSPKTTVE